MFSWRDAFTVREISTHVLHQYRYSLDRQTFAQVVWQPYSTELIKWLPPYCSDGTDIWQAVVPLIYFFIVEMHHSDRTIPHNCDTVIALHNLDLRGTKTKDWVNHHKEWIQLWDQRRTCIAIGEPWDGNMHGDDPYMVWYRRITCQYISRATCTFDFVALAALHEQDRFARVPPQQPNVHAHAEVEPSDGVDSEPHVERDFTFIPYLRSMLNDWCQTPIRMEDFGNAMTEQHEEGVAHSEEGVSHTVAGALHSGDGLTQSPERVPAFTKTVTHSEERGSHADEQHLQTTHASHEEVPVSAIT
ncbi:hypothetical protein ACSBR1_034259 [Camellia fascicularis]